MFFMESFDEISSHDANIFIQEALHDPQNSEFREVLIDPIFEKLKDKNIQKQYIEFGDKFIESNFDMLSKEYPTKPVAFPQKYVDNVLKLFGFNVKELRNLLVSLLKKANDSEYYDMKITASPTNALHAIVLYYSDMSLNENLRDSARQQLGLTIYGIIYNAYLKGVYDEGVMAYTYMTLNRSWLLVKSENVINWITTTVDTYYALWKSKMSINMSISVMASFLQYVRNAFNQNMRKLSNIYFKNLNDKKSNGSDIGDEDEYVVTNNFTKTRNDIMQLIRNGDSLYKTKSSLYNGIGRLKNVKVDILYEFAQKVDYKDIENIIDGIFYVFLVKEGNSMKDINSVKYMSRITNLPTAVDRAIVKKPIILPLSRKYKCKSSIVIAYICLIATYIMQRIDQVSQ